jgi:protocatechuate 3,4-dioxygenase beta subunit
VIVEAEGKAFIEIRLRRFGSIGGTVWDENEIGLPDIEVVAYRASQPPELAGRGLTDERGMFRIGGLSPGRYYVRSAAAQLNDGSGVLPTFFSGATAIDLARLVDADLDRETGDINFRPAGGRLIRIAGRVDPPGTVAVVALVSDMGRRTTTTSGAGAFEFRAEAPGRYELEIDGRHYALGQVTGWTEFTADRDIENLHVVANRDASVQIEVLDQNGNTLDPRAVTVLARRRDLSGAGVPRALKAGERTSLAAGRWEMALAASPGYYPVKFDAAGARGRGRADGWNQLSALYSGTVRFVVSTRPASIGGRVIGEAVAGAPVFLEAYDLDARKRLLDVRVARADLAGRYRFDGLAPGKYRIFASFEFENPEERDFEEARAAILSVAEDDRAQRDLDLYVAR